MALINARKFFARRVSITGGTAISFLGLMQAAPSVTGTPAWSTNSDGSPSMDSAWGDGGSITAVTGVIYIGYDAQVRNIDTAINYLGIPVAAGLPFSLQDYFPGPVDPAQIWIWSPTTQKADVTFQGR